MRIQNRGSPPRRVASGVIASNVQTRQRLAARKGDTECAVALRRVGTNTRRESEAEERSGCSSIGDAITRAVGRRELCPASRPVGQSRKRSKRQDVPHIPDGRAHRKQDAFAIRISVAEACLRLTSAQCGPRLHGTHGPCSVIMTNRDDSNWARRITQSMARHSPVSGFP